MATYRQSESHCGEGYLDHSVSRLKRGKELHAAKVRVAEDIGCRSVVVCYVAQWL